jgi:hypothetical protein
MSDPIRCKRIIEGMTYNTETATLLGRWNSDDSPYEEALFKTRHGAYFVYFFQDTKPDEGITPLAPEAAQHWMEKHCSPEMIEAEFGEMPEAGAPEARITLRIPETLRKRIAAIAESRSQSLNAWIQRCVERGAADAEAAQ